jgi:hypothetical protein
MTTDYFNEGMVNRQRLLWAIATRRQLERWEPLVAAILNETSPGGPSTAGPGGRRRPSITSRSSLRGTSCTRSTSLR